MVKRVVKKENEDIIPIEYGGKSQEKVVPLNTMLLNL